MKNNWFEEFYKRFGASGTALFVIVVLILGGFGSLLMQKIALPYLSTWPIIRQIDALQPEAPIVITRREEVRIDDGINQVDVVNQVKSSLVTIYQHQGQFDSGDFRVISMSTGVIVSGDGLVVVPASLADENFNLTAITSQEKVYSAEMLETDPLTSLSLLKIDTENLPVIRQGFSKDLRIGERLIAVWSSERSERPFSTLVNTSYPGHLRPGLIQEYRFDQLNILLNIDNLDKLTAPGTVLVNHEGQLIGLLADNTANKIVRSEDVQHMLNNYLADEQVVWPALNSLTYQVFGPDQTEIFDLPADSGILVKTPGGSLQEDDFIFEVDGNNITLQEGFQNLLLNKEPGDQAELMVVRDGEIKQVELEL